MARVMARTVARVMARAMANVRESNRMYCDNTSDFNNK